MAHSQGGNFAFTAALRAPDKVKAVIAIEPAGTPDLSKSDLGPLRNVPHLFVWAAYIEASPFWQKVYSNLRNYRQALDGQGTATDWVDLHAVGIKGNSHMPMMDKNSDQVAGVVQKWMGDKALMQ